MLKNLFQLNLPYNFDMLVIKKKTNNAQLNFNFTDFIDIHFFNTNEHFRININKFENSVFFSKDTNCIFFEHNKFGYKYIYNLHILSNITLLWDSLIFIKIKFKGKGYKIKYFKKNKIMIFFFGRAHTSIFKFKNIDLTKIGKYKFVLKHWDKRYLYNLAKNIIKIRKINIYTLRGIRLSKQIILKRKGKKSSYI